MTPGIYAGPGASGTSGWPSVTTKYGYVIVLRRSGTQVMQMVMYRSSTGVEFHIRAYSGGTWSAWNVFAPPTLAATSTDNATSATDAPLKTAGGLAVAKDAWVGGVQHVGRFIIDTVPQYSLAAGASVKITVETGAYGANPTTGQVAIEAGSSATGPSLPSRCNMADTQTATMAT
jgi:hypothetical protein